MWLLVPRLAHEGRKAGRTTCLSSPPTHHRRAGQFTGKYFPTDASAALVSRPRLNAINVDIRASRQAATSHDARESAQPVAATTVD